MNDEDKTFYRALLLITVVIVALALSPWLLWNFVRYVRDGFEAYP